MSGNPPSTKQGLYVVGERDNPKAALGTSVYAEYDGYGITLTTENGQGPSNLIYLEPAVLDALDLFRQAMMGYKQPKFWGAGDYAEARAAEFFSLGLCASPGRHALMETALCRSCFIVAVAVELRRRELALAKLLEER